MPWRADFSWVWFMELFAIPAYLSGCQNQRVNSQAGLSTPVCGPITPLPAPFLVPFQSWDFIATDIGTLNLSFLICEVGVKESYLEELKVLEDKKETIIPTFEGHNGLVKSEDNPCSNLTGEETGFWKMVSFSWQETESGFERKSLLAECVLPIPQQCTLETTEITERQPRSSRGLCFANNRLKDKYLQNFFKNPVSYQTQ